MSDENPDKNERATRTTTVQYETNPVNPADLERLVRMETTQQDVLRRVAQIEQRTIDALPGAADKIRLIAADMLRPTEARLMVLETKHLSGIEGADDRIRALIEERVKRLDQSIGDLQKIVSMLETKAHKWEGGGSVIYIVVSVVGAGIGWLLSHLGAAIK